MPCEKFGNGASARISSPAPAENDARLVQDVAVRPHTRYRLSAYIRTDAVSAFGAGANLSVQWPGRFTRRTWIWSEEFTPLVKLIDFGVSTHVEPAAPTGAPVRHELIGSPARRSGALRSAA